MGRAELRRQQKAEAKKIGVETVSRKTNLSVETLVKWREQEHDELVKQIETEYRRKLEKAEDLIMAAMIFSAMNAVRDSWKTKLDLKKYYENLMLERDLAFGTDSVAGIKRAKERAEAESGMEFEYSDMDLNKEFNCGDWDLYTEINSMTPNRAYDFGYANASILGNIINTSIYVDQMLKRGYERSEIMKIITESNYTARRMREGDGDVTKLLLSIKKRGIDFGEDTFKKLKEFRM